MQISLYNTNMLRDNHKAAHLLVGHYHQCLLKKKRSSSLKRKHSTKAAAIKKRMIQQLRGTTPVPKLGVVKHRGSPIKHFI